MSNSTWGLLFKDINGSNCQWRLTGGKCGGFIGTNVQETGEITFFGLAIEDPPPVIESFLSRVVGDALEGGTYSSRNLEAARAASEVSPVIVMVRFLGFKHGLSGVAGGNGVVARNMEG